MKNAWVEEKEIQDVKLGELEQLCKDAFDIQAGIKLKESEIKNQKEALSKLNLKIAAILEAHGKKNYESSVGKISRVENLSYRTPKTEEDKKKFFAWLQNKGIFWQYVSVNSRSLNALCRTEFDEAKSRGEEIEIPGIESPSVYETVTMKRKK